MSSVRGRRGGSAADGRRTARPPRTSVTGPVRGVAPRRPGQRRTPRRPARSSAPAPSARRRPLFTGRALLLGSLVLLLALTLAGPVRQYLAGQAELAQLAAEGRALEQRAAELEAQRDRQNDDDWLAQQARERLAYVLPGDRLVVVVDGEARTSEERTAPAAGSGPALPWYEGLLDSVARADDGGAADEGAAPDDGAAPDEGAAPDDGAGTPGG
jgi:cell division protein FtsB